MPLRAGQEDAGQKQAESAQAASQTCLKACFCSKNNESCSSCACWSGLNPEPVSTAPHTISRGLSLADRFWCVHEEGPCRLQSHCWLLNLRPTTASINQSANLCCCIHHRCSVLSAGAPVGLVVAARFARRLFPLVASPQARPGPVQPWCDAVYTVTRPAAAAAECLQRASSPLPHQTVMSSLLPAEAHPKQ